MDFRTSLELLLTQTTRRQQKDEEMATVSLIKAMDFHKSEEFWFNESTFLWTMTTGAYEYPMTTDPKTAADPADRGAPPSDIWTLSQIQIQVGLNWYEPLREVSMSQIRDLVFTESNLGYPSYYAIWGNEIWFYPIPNSNFPVRQDYIRQIDKPRFTFNGTDWVFEENQIIADVPTWVPLTPTYTNGWLQQAEPMIRAWARWDLYHAYYKDRDAAAEAQIEYVKELRNLQHERDRRHQGNIHLIAQDY